MIYLFMIYVFLFCSNGAILVYDIIDEDSFFKVLLHSDSFMQTILYSNGKPDQRKV